MKKPVQQRPKARVKVLDVPVALPGFWAAIASDVVKSSTRLNPPG